MHQVYPQKYFYEIATFKESKSKNYASKKKVWKRELNSCYKGKVNSKAFIIPFLIASASKCIKINFCSVATVEFHLKLVSVLLTCLDSF